jgi:sulfoquinovosyltransferase
VNGVERVDVWRKGIDTERFNPKFKSNEARKMLTATTTTTGNEGAKKKSSSSSISQQDEDAQQQQHQQQRQRELEQPLLLYVGRLGMEKRLRDLKQVLVSNPSYRLAMVGKGPDEEALKEHFKGLNAVFCGQMSGDALSSAFASADVFVMPSDSGERELIMEPPFVFFSILLSHVRFGFEVFP